MRERYVSGNVLSREGLEVSLSKIVYFVKNENVKQLNMIDGILTVLEFKYLVYGSNFYSPVNFFDIFTCHLLGCVYVHEGFVPTFILIVKSFLVQLVYPRSSNICHNEQINNYAPPLKINKFIFKCLFV